MPFWKKKKKCCIRFDKPYIRDLYKKVHVDFDLKDLSSGFWSCLEKIDGIESIIKNDRYHFEVRRAECFFPWSAIDCEVENLLNRFTQDRYGRVSDNDCEEKIKKHDCEETPKKKKKVEIIIMGENKGKNPKKVFILISDGKVKQIESKRDDICELDEGDQVLHVTKVEEAVVATQDAKLSDFFKSGDDPCED